ncbi:ATP-dependent zinc metalloprotease FtsH [Candidatus Hepatincola sp. Pdp]
MKNSLVVALLLLIAVYVGFNYYNTEQHKPTTQVVSYTQFMNLLDNKKVNIIRASINSNMVKAEDNKHNVYMVAFPYGDSSLIDKLKQNKIDISVPLPESKNSWGTLFFLGLAMLFIYFLIRRVKNQGDMGSGGSQGGVGGAFGFGRSKARMINPQDIKEKFADVAGVDEAKEDLQEIVEFLKYPDKFKKLGAEVPKGCLLVGAPGTGKTLLAKAIAGESGVAFFSISGSDFVEMFVGVGASRVRDLFVQAKKHSPCIIFIDEIDAVGRQRGVGVGGGNDEREQTLNQLLVEMDGFSQNQGIIILAATNRPEILDKALLRPGRFDRQVVVPLPDLVGRERILQIYLAKIPLDTKVDAHVVARGTTGFSGADLKNLVNEAALSSARANRTVVTMDDFEAARDKIIMGSERKSSKLSDEEKLLTAYHEAGHALVAFKAEGSYPVHKVTIIPRGRSLGVTSFLPERDEYSRSYKQLTAQLAVLFGGRLAEELKFGKEYITTGASMDIKMATDIAKRMVTEWGFSDLVGRVRHKDENEGYYPATPISDHTAKIIEEETRALIEAAEAKAKSILTKYSQEHKKLSEALLKYETLSGEQAKRICNNEEMNPQENKNKVADVVDANNAPTSVPVVNDEQL